MYKLVINDDELINLYSILCDAIYRDHAGISDSDPFFHTSNESRRLASKIVDRLTDADFLEVMD